MGKTEKPAPDASPALRSVEELTEALAAPFDPHAVRFKPGVVSGNRALALVYVDARVIQDRLDEVLGVAGWQDEYECLPDGSVVCRLRLRLGDEWITKMDVGGPSEQPDEGDRRKAAFSDALKRAAVKFGIGRYLYRLPSQWVDYDPHKKQFVRTPPLPPSAIPRPAAAPAAVIQSPQPAEKPAREAARESAPARRPATVRVAASPTPAPPQEQAAPRPGSALPASGVELKRRLYDYDARLAKRGLCRPGELVQHVVQAGVKAGYPDDLATWSGPAITLAVEETRAFEVRSRKERPAQKEVA
jgi:Rad52/22 family double-strand break repair protein